MNALSRYLAPLKPGRAVLLWGGRLRPLAAELGLKTGQFFGLLRIAVTGQTAAPPLFQTMEVLGKERCLKRIDDAHSRLGKQ